MITLPEILAFWLNDFVTLSIQTLKVIRVIMYSLTTLQTTLVFILNTCIKKCLGLIYRKLDMIMMEHILL